MGRLSMQPVRCILMVLHGCACCCSQYCLLPTMLHFVDHISIYCYAGRLSGVVVVMQTLMLFGFQVQKPASFWEFYICSEVHRRLKIYGLSSMVSVSHKANVICFSLEHHSWLTVSLLVSTV